MRNRMRRCGEEDWWPKVWELAPEKTADDLPVYLHSHLKAWQQDSNDLLSNSLAESSENKENNNKKVQTTNKGISLSICLRILYNHFVSTGQAVHLDFSQDSHLNIGTVSTSVNAAYLPHRDDRQRCEQTCTGVGGHVIMRCASQEHIYMSVFAQEHNTRQPRDTDGRLLFLLCKQWLCLL